MELPAILRSPDRPTAVARILAGLGALLLALGVTGPLASALLMTFRFEDVSPARVWLLLGVAAATATLAVLGRTRWFIWCAVAIVGILGSMASFGGGDSMELPGPVKKVINWVAEGALNLVTFHYGTPCLALGILLILGVGVWRCRAAR